jgi:segregation and condensation protein B
MDDREEKKALLEAMIFLSGETVTPAELKAATGIHEADIRDIAEELVQEYAERGGGIVIGRVAGGYRMQTNPDYSEIIAKFRGSVKTQKLSLAALETLAIIAYKQPITKAELEELRSANSDGVVRSLLDKRLIKIMGKKEAPGRPLLYGTTREFLEYFGLNDLTELPTLKDLAREDAA